MVRPDTSGAPFASTMAAPPPPDCGTNAPLAPAAAHFFPRKKDHNRAEAALLGAYYVERLRVAA